MRLSVIPAMAVAALLGGCSALQGPEYPATGAGHFTPTISKDGVHGFTYNLVGKGSPEDPAIQAEHELRLSQELGRRQFCLKGYELTGTERKVATGSPYYGVVYTGQCK
ncbi:MAG: hypothetical protein WA154_11060 [Moraxellaceae bacterium]